MAVLHTSPVILHSAARRGLSPPNTRTHIPLTPRHLSNFLAQSARQGLHCRRNRECICILQLPHEASKRVRPKMMMMKIAVILILIPITWVAWLFLSNRWTRRCPKCRSRALRKVSSLIADGTTPDSCGGFEFFRCTNCSCALQRHNGGPVSEATHWRMFIEEREAEQTAAASAGGGQHKP